MAESLFDIFGDHITRQSTKNISRQPLFNNENIGKAVLNEPLKNELKEPLKKGLEPMKKASEIKKSFFSNIGKAVESTPQKICTPSIQKIFRTQDVYSVLDSDEDQSYLEELEFTKPTIKYGNYHTDLLDFFIPTQSHLTGKSPPSSPVPISAHHSMEFDISYEDDFLPHDHNDMEFVTLYEDDSFTDGFLI